MSLSQLPVLVLGFLLMAWGWTLGPVLLAAFRRNPERGSEPLAEDEDLGFRWPWEAWASLTIQRKRLQVLLGLSTATFVSMLLGIAIGGRFVGLFVVMLTFLVIFCCYGAFVGSRELRARAEAFPSGQGAVGEDRLGLFDSGFFEPIPELVSAPGSPSAGLIEMEELVAELAASDVEEAESTADEAADVGQSVGEAEQPRRRQEPSFTVASNKQQRKRRPKARPIYIEAEFDEDQIDGNRAVND